MSRQAILIGQELFLLRVDTSKSEQITARTESGVRLWAWRGDCAQKRGRESERLSESMADDKRETAYRILAYLLENPNAQDTLEGIVEWWLLDRFTKSSAAKVKEALENLVTAGLVLERRGKGSRTYYTINRRKLKGISALLREGGSTAGTLRN